MGSPVAETPKMRITNSYSCASALALSMVCPSSLLLSTGCWYCNVDKTAEKVDDILPDQLSASIHIYDNFNM